MLFIFSLAKGPAFCASDTYLRWAHLLYNNISWINPFFSSFSFSLNCFLVIFASCLFLSNSVNSLWNAFISSTNVFKSSFIIFISSFMSAKHFFNSAFWVESGNFSLQDVFSSVLKSLIFVRISFISAFIVRILIFKSAICRFVSSLISSIFWSR